MCPCIATLFDATLCSNVQIKLQVACHNQSATFGPEKKSCCSSLSGHLRPAAQALETTYTPIQISPTSRQIEMSQWPSET